MMTTVGLPIQKPSLQIMTSTKIYPFGDRTIAVMNDGMHYTHPEFLKHPVGTRFAVLREMSSVFFGGEIRQVIEIL